MTSGSPFLVSHTVSVLSVLRHLARSSAPIMLNYRQNMELGHCGQATAIIKPRGVAEIHRSKGARPCPQPRRVAFKGAISFTPRIFITVYSKFLVKQMNSNFYEWVTFTLPINLNKKAGTAQRRKSLSTERGNEGKQRRGTRSHKAAWKEEKSGGNIRDEMKPAVMSLGFNTADYARVAHVFSSCN